MLAYIMGNSTLAPTAASARSQKLYEDFVNPQWVRLLDLLGMNVTYERCIGTELFTSRGERKLDFLSGYGVYNAGHNHPEIVEALRDELLSGGPAMLQSHVPELAGELARQLCQLAGGRMKKVFFPNSGSEGVEAAIKFARAHTRRNGILYAQGGFHGLTCGALSLMSNPFWREGFGPLLQDTESVPFGDLAQLEEKLASRQFAAYILEPIQSEAGVCLPPNNYLQQVQKICRENETLFVLDEVQTGIYRTGRFLAAHHFEVEPDMVILAKALSGGLVPVGAVLMTDEISASVYSSLGRAFIHTSTFSENSLAMRAGLATLHVLTRDHLGEDAVQKGDWLLKELRARLATYDMFEEVRGLGMMNGIVFQAPSRFPLKLSFQAFRSVHPAMFGQMMVMQLFRDQHILTQICGNNFMVIKAAPPLTVTYDQLRMYVDAVEETVSRIHGSSAFWLEALGLARRAVSI